MGLKKRNHKVNYRKFHMSYRTFLFFVIDHMYILKLKFSHTHRQFNDESITLFRLTNLYWTSVLLL